MRESFYQIIESQWNVVECFGLTIGEEAVASCCLLRAETTNMPPSPSSSKINLNQDSKDHPASPASLPKRKSFETKTGCCTRVAIYASTRQFEDRHLKVPGSRGRFRNNIFLQAGRHHKGSLHCWRGIASCMCLIETWQDVPTLGPLRSNVMFRTHLQY